jgi:hypothetical protein
MRWLILWLVILCCGCTTPPPTPSVLSAPKHKYQHHHPLKPNNKVVSQSNIPMMNLMDNDHATP